jgi:hypothetical protein
MMTCGGRFITDVSWDRAPEGLREAMAQLDRPELERLSALAVEALIASALRAGVEIERFQRRYAKRKTDSGVLLKEHAFARARSACLVGPDGRRRSVE